ncbi:Lsr2 family protein [Amycolatopsis sp. OK19-0408]|uniref:Lsr2 family protein n=1 Tax=Amycolatopsis iheyensis TaxID=2945988 RepID=A0A9X2SMX0_9PSEU|nr:Lsr2 family protein [Amycolatopsis iheyensis]MCR6488257.1 Lsr2 family protein [Amycolatopsis iheyensis]
MARNVKVELLDDIDGTAATQTVTFALDGIEYEIDLSDENAEGLRAELGGYIEAARRTGGRKRRNTATGSTSVSSNSTSREHSKKVRAWAKANGHEISDRGRLSTEIIDLYKRAQETEPEPAKPKRGSRKKVAAAKR